MLPRCYLPFLGALFLAASLTGCAAGEGTDWAEQELAEVDCAAPVELPSATLLGRRDGTACAYKGVRYAKPPLGSLRFQPPQPLGEHQGTVLARSYGPDCVQTPVFQDVPVGEDCLFLNVWIPGESADGSRLEELPVMVFFYGGGFTMGGGSWAFYNGERFTTHGVILVTVNYRLGPLGYLAPSAVTDAAGVRLEGNLGLRDQIASLQWVQYNIARLGGDPGRVTIFGESAGAWSVCALIGSAETKGLFHRAIMQSGECGMGDRDEIAGKADAWIAQTGCPATGTAALDCLRKLDAATLPEDYGYSMGGGMYPTVDGKVLPEQPLDRIKSGAAAHIALITGYNREETNALRIMPAHSGRIQMSFPEFWEDMEGAMTAEQVTQVRKYYRNKTYSDPMALATEILNDLVFVCPAVDAVAAQASHRGGAWHYRFSVGDDETVLEPYTGSFHGLEIPYVFGNTKGLVFLYSDAEKWTRMNDMVERIQRYWTRFAATGDPNGGDDPRWPGFGENRSRMELSIEASVMPEENEALCAFWGKTAPLAVGDRFDYIEKLIGFHPIR